MPAVPAPDSALATRDDIRRLEEMILALKREIDRIVHDQEVQFKRIAQLQAEMDLVRRAWTKKPPSDEEEPSAKRPT